LLLAIDGIQIQKITELNERMKASLTELRNKYPSEESDSSDEESGPSDEESDPAEKIFNLLQSNVNVDQIKYPEIRKAINVAKKILDSWYDKFQEKE